MLCTQLHVTSVLIVALVLFGVIIIAESHVRVTHNATIPLTKDIKNLRVLYRKLQSESSEYVYVASVNKIEQYDALNLQLVASRVTGPRNFSLFCLGVDSNCGKCVLPDRSGLPLGYKLDSCERRPTDNYVKAWGTSTVSKNSVEGYYNNPSWESDENDRNNNDDRIALEDALYVCYNVFHGFCERLRLINVSEEASWSPKDGLQPFGRSVEKYIPVVGSLPSTYATLVVGSRYIFVATEPDGLQEITLITHDPLTARLRNFGLASSQREPESSVKLSTNPSLRIQYKASFRYRPHSSNPASPSQLPGPSYIYFVFHQPESASFLRWQPRIARICDGDAQFYSYVEISIVCRDCMKPEFEDKVSSQIVVNYMLIS